jgi:hypothetical protein
MLCLYRPGLKLFTSQVLKDRIAGKEFFEMGSAKTDGIFEGTKFKNSGLARVGLNETFQFRELVLTGTLAEGTPVVLMPGCVFEEVAERFGFTLLAKQAEILPS